MVRVEEGSLREITLALADSIGQTALVTGTVFLLGSVSQLVNVGVAQYASDWVRSRWWLRERFGEGIMVVPLPPVPVGGVSGRHVVRAILDSLHWFMSLDSTESVIMKSSMQTFITLHLAKGGESGWADERQAFRLPASLDSRSSFTYVSEGWGSRPEGVPPLSTAAEKTLIDGIVSTLETAFTLGLCTSPCLERDGGAIHRAKRASREQHNYLVIGGSNATRLADAVGGLRCYVDRITTSGWKITADTVAAAVERLGTLAIQPDVVIIQALDNNSFFALGEDGCLSLPVCSDGSYHIVGG